VFAATKTVGAILSREDRAPASERGFLWRRIRFKKRAVKEPLILASFLSRVIAPILSEEEAMLGKTISHYRILEKLGGGGMGVVYKAEDLKLKRFVALKFLPPELLRDEEAKARFIHEAQAASSLDHPNICTIYEIDEIPPASTLAPEEQAGQMFIAMAFYEGETLRARIAKGEERREKGEGRREKGEERRARSEEGEERLTAGLPIAEALDIAIQIAQGLAKAHAHGIIHRDLKPANVMITNEGAAKIIDFGLAKLASAARLTVSGAVQGTVAYMSPEQAGGEEVDRRTDIWSLGVALYEMLAGQLPFKGDLWPPVIYAILNEEPAPLSALRPDLPDALERIVAKALRKDRSERYQSIDEMLNELKFAQRELAPQSATQVQPFAAPRRGKFAVPYPGLAVLLLIVLLGITLLLRRNTEEKAAAIAPDKYRIAVLPLVNISSDEGDEYFSEGMTEELISTLSKVNHFRVIARTSVMRYKGGTQDITAIGRELQVGTILEGSVRKADSKLRITVQLIDVRSQEPLWSRDYDRELDDVFAIQNDIAQRVAEALRMELPVEEKSRIEKPATENFEAYTAFLQGRFFWNKRTPADLQKSIPHFEQAIAHDSSYARAYAGLADAYAVLGTVEYGGLPAHEARSQARAAAMKALALDEQCAEAHAALANVLFTYEWNWPEAEREFRRALVLNPNDAVTRHLYAHYLAARGRLDEARFEIEQARALDPLSLIINTAAGMIFYFRRQPEQALAQLHKTLEMDPGFVPAVLQLGAVYAHERRFDEAIAAFQKGVALTGERPIKLALLGYAHGASGRRSEALALLAKLRQSPAQLPASPVHFVLVYLGLGENDKVFEWLEKAYEQRSNYLVYLKVEPLLDGLRSDSRFVALLRKMELEEK
jgi:serine/threonine-protein kinase